MDVNNYDPSDPLSSYSISSENTSSPLYLGARETHSQNVDYEILDPNKEPQVFVSLLFKGLVVVTTLREIEEEKTVPLPPSLKDRNVSQITIALGDKKIVYKKGEFKTRVQTQEEMRRISLLANAIMQRILMQQNGQKDASASSESEAAEKRAQISGKGKASAKATERQAPMLPYLGRRQTRNVSQEITLSHDEGVKQERELKQFLKKVEAFDEKIRSSIKTSNQKSATIQEGIQKSNIAAEQEKDEKIDSEAPRIDGRRVLVQKTYTGKMKNIYRRMVM